VRGDVTSNDRSVAATQQNYFNNVRQSELGMADDYDRSVRRATQQNYFENDDPAYGRPEDYNKSLQASQEYKPQPELDESGHSVSSEGDIADHGIFNADSGPPGQQAPNLGPGPAGPGPAGLGPAGPGPAGPGLAGPGQQRSPSPHFQEQKLAPDAQAQAIQPRRTTKGGKAKQILYSDKSETSVEELMDDTPSNYNI
jgi:hypothetical protein